jgi:hypothetical protein
MSSPSLIRIDSGGHIIVFSAKVEPAGKRRVLAQRKNVARGPTYGFKHGLRRLRFCLQRLMPLRPPSGRLEN